MGSCPDVFGSQVPKIASKNLFNEYNQKFICFLREKAFCFFILVPAGKRCNRILKFAAGLLNK